MLSGHIIHADMVGFVRERTQKMLGHPLNFVTDGFIRAVIQEIASQHGLTDEIEISVVNIVSQMEAELDELLHVERYITLCPKCKGLGVSTKTFTLCPKCQGTGRRPM